MPTPLTPPETSWPTPSPEVAELMRRAAEFILSAPPEWLDELDSVYLRDEEGNPLPDDPVMLAAARRINRSGLLHWASANIQNPGQPVPPYISADMENNTREMVRRGLRDRMMNSGRAVQNVAWQLWMRIAFRLTRDPDVLEELLQVSAHSIGAYIDGYMQEISKQAANEARRRDSHADKRELVTLILESGEVSASLASSRLDYPMDQTHYGAMIWSEAPSPKLRDLEDAAKALADGLSAPRPLIVLAGSATLWVWCASSNRLDRRHLESALRATPDVRIALGAPAPGIDGFRRSHLEAHSVQRVLGRLDAPAAVVGIEQVRLVALMTQDTKAARYFISQTLGDLANATPVLQRSLRIFLSQGCNVTEAAEVLHTHRNTLLRRLERAQALLPRPLAEYRLDVAAALEALSWIRPEIDEAAD
jgi:DNA-binding PucR family transcriptional regulator